MKKLFLLFPVIILTGCSLNTISQQATSTTSNNPVSETERLCSEYAQQEKDFAKKLDDNAILQGVNIPRADYKKIYDDTYRDCVLFRTMK